MLKNTVNLMNGLSILAVSCTCLGLFSTVTIKIQEQTLGHMIVLSSCFWQFIKFGCVWQKSSINMDKICICCDLCIHFQNHKWLRTIAIVVFCLVSKRCEVLQIYKGIVNNYSKWLLNRIK